MATDEIIADIFNEVGKKYGYEYVTTDVANYNAFKIKYEKSFDSRMLKFHVSHYMRYAPDWFIVEAANRVVAKVSNMYAPEPSPRYIKWIEENRYMWS